ncbi:hypothetical protein [Dongia sp.]|uniref:hypothetical protein n=1 Tax=Dongia sp. TaxID=1977262 RepID=UPI003753D835
MSLSIGSDGDGSNAGDIKGTIAHHLLVALAIFVSASFIIWNGRRLIPGSPFNHLEVGPEGFAVSGLLGRSHRPWASIARFAVRTLPHIQPPIFWVRAVPRKSGDKDLRFFMGGYTPFSVFPTRRKDVAAIADWLEAIKKSYRTGTPFPPRPVGLAAHIIERPVTTSTSAIDADTRGKHG